MPKFSSCYKLLTIRELESTRVHDPRVQVGRARWKPEKLEGASVKAKDGACFSESSKSFVKNGRRRPEGRDAFLTVL
jgi:hypothetical protein